MMTFGLIALLILLGSGCVSKSIPDTKKSENEIPYPADPPPKDALVPIYVVGLSSSTSKETSTNSTIELRFEEEGIILAFNVSEGDEVKTGQIIAELDHTVAKIKLARALQEYYRYEKLYALGGVSRSKLEEAKVQMEYTQWKFGKTYLRAPKDGSFKKKLAVIGEFTAPENVVGIMELKR